MIVFLILSVCGVVCGIIYLADKFDDWLRR